MNDKEFKDAVIYEATNGECPHCKFLYETFLEHSDQYTGDRDYYLMTEVFVYLHGGDECNYHESNEVVE